ncbi:MAG: hypothetical protein GC145_15095 [Caulobacter sp.]|nr:hypothetical protein [Caulobacter sp.]
MTRPGRIVAAAMLFGLAMLAAGWLLGPVRVLLIEPRLGSVAAVWLEAPIMLAVILVSARWVSRRFRLAGDLAARLTVGSLALALVIAAELAGALALRGQAPAETLAALLAPAGLPVLGLYLVVLLAPVLVGGGFEQDQGGGA